MSLARLVVTAVRVEGRTKAEWARDYGVSSRWVYECCRRFDAGGEAGLEPRSRPPRRSPQRTAEGCCTSCCPKAKGEHATGLRVLAPPPEIASVPRTLPSRP